MIGHANIIKFCGRPFSNPDEMTERLREWHNSFVKPQDHWYNLGDVTMERGSAHGKQAIALINEIKRWHGHKRLILGNHDHFPMKVYLEAGFKKIYGTWKGIDNILLSHYPLHESGLFNVAANVHGHIHQNPSPKPAMFVLKETGKVRVVPYVNMSVEAINYRPIHLDELKAMIEEAKRGA